METVSLYYCKRGESIILMGQYGTVSPSAIWQQNQLRAKRTGMKKTRKLLLLLLVTVTPAAAQKLDKANPAGLSKPAPGTYTQVIRAGKLLFIAGQTGTNAEGKVVGPGMKEQVEQVFTNLVTALKSQGADLSHVTKMTTFVTSISEFRAPDVAAVL